MPNFYFHIPAYCFLLKVFCTNLKVSCCPLSKMLTNTDVVDSTSGKKKCFVIQDKSQRPSNAVFAVLLGGKTYKWHWPLPYMKEKMFFLEDWKLTASSIPLNIHTFYLVNSERISVFVWKIKICEFKVSSKEEHQINLD